MILLTSEQASSLPYAVFLELQWGSELQTFEFWIENLIFMCSHFYIEVILSKHGIIKVYVAFGTMPG